MKTKEIQEALCKAEVLKGNLPCENVSYVFSGECDVLSILKSGYVFEFEVKISRSDFKADAKKKYKWQSFDARRERQIPNYFSYVCPDGLIRKDEIPSYAGLIYANNDSVRVVKKATLLHRYKHNTLTLLAKFCRVKSERQYLGSCLLTYKNNEIKNKD